MGITRYPGATNRTVDFTSSGTWVCPSGVYSAEFLVVGAGGAGGCVTLSSASNYGVAGGGGGGAVKKITLATIPGSSYTITIGAKGVGATGAAGTNGGFSEVVLSGSTLIRSFGGQGGSGLAGGVTIAPTLSGSVAGAGGTANGDNATSTWLGGGGGGAFAANMVTTRTTNQQYGSEGTPSNVATSTASQTYAAWAGIGFDVYGYGGTGGMTTPNVNYNAAAGAWNSGSGASRTSTGATAGGSAGANSGNGGGGAAAFLSTTAVAGGNGGDGIVRINYFA